MSHRGARPLLGPSSRVPRHSFVTKLALIHGGVRPHLRPEYGFAMRPIDERFPRPSVMGVVNVTPDSFSDGGVNFRADDAVASARRMVEEAAIVDVGGESTRPGAEPVSAEEELRRIEPVLEQLQGVPVSIHTAKAEVARRALELGAELVNDVTALPGDPVLAGVVAESGAYLCLMHMQGEPRSMQASPHLRRRRLRRQGVPRGATALPRRCRDRGGADLRRSGHRLRQDGRAQLRARPPS